MSVSNKYAATHGWVHLRNLQITNASVGVLPHEQHSHQTLRVHLHFYINVQAAAHADHLAHTVDWGSIAPVVQQVVLERHYNLIETLAEKLFQRLVALYSGPSQLARLSLEIYKDHCLPSGAASVQISRHVVVQQAEVLD